MLMLDQGLKDLHYNCVVSMSVFFRVSISQKKEVAVTILSESADTDAVLFVLVAKQRKLSFAVWFAVL